MSELCHICDLFRTALFGPTNTNEDHLDDGQGNDLPRPMADAPATMGIRSRARPGGVAPPAGTNAGANAGTNTSAVKARVGDAQPAPAAGNGATAASSVASDAAASSSAVARSMDRAAAAPQAARGEAVAAAPVAADPVVTAPVAAAPVTTAAPAAGTLAAPPGKPVPKTKFSKRASRGLKSAPAYMSFDDVDVEDDDSDGELFIEESRPRRHSGTRSPGTIAAQASAMNYSVNAPSVYREPAPRGGKLPGASPVVMAPAAPADEAPPAPAYDSFAAPAPDVSVAVTSVAQNDGGGASGSDRVVSSASAVQGSDADVGSVSSRGAVAGDISMDGYSVGTAAGGKGTGRIGGNSMAGGDHRIASIPRDGSVLESARPHGQSESFHGYKGYPGYEPETPVASQLTHQVGRNDTTESLTININQGNDVSGRRDQQQQHQQHQAQLPAPTPSSVRVEPRAVHGAGGTGGSRRAPKRPGSIESELVEGQQPPSISPSGTMDLASVGGESHIGQAHGLSSRQQHVAPGPGMSYGSQGGSAYRASPSHSVANSMASSFRRDDSRNIPQQPSEDGMGSVLGTIAGNEDAANEDLQWKRSALKKFHKVMVKGEGLRVVKHNRSGGSQMRIIRYDPEIKALVWNSKRYMKKAGAANVPIVGIKRVGREGNTVSVTAAGRGTIGFEPQRIRDAKILAEALLALVDKEERSAMWRG